MLSSWNSANFDRWTTFVGQVDLQIHHPPPPHMAKSDFSADLHWSQIWPKIREKRGIPRIRGGFHCLCILFNLHFTVQKCWRVYHFYTLIHAHSHFLQGCICSTLDQDQICVNTVVRTDVKTVHTPIWVVYKSIHFLYTSWPPEIFQAWNDSCHFCVHYLIRRIIPVFISPACVWEDTVI